MKADKVWRSALKVLYGFVFVVLLPLFLVLFSAKVETPLGIARFPIPGAIVTILGLTITLWGMPDIWKRGNGLPGNAFPPEKLVTGRIYGVVPRPIYSGFVMGCLGVSLALGSATGVFLTTPLVALCAIALVLGYERPYLLRTFGTLPRPLLGLANLSTPAVSVLRLDRLWAGVLDWAERLANSWSSARIGPGARSSDGDRPDLLRRVWLRDGRGLPRLTTKVLQALGMRPCPRRRWSTRIVILTRPQRAVARLAARTHRAA